jgi:Fe-S cluster biogenesis protein NfuA
MNATASNDEFRSQMSQLESLLERARSIKDPAAGELITQIVQSLMDFHGAGIARMLDCIDGTSDTGQQILQKLAGDELVGNLLLLYGLHPESLEVRVRKALEKCRPYLGSHGGNVELLSISEEGVVRLEMQGSCHGCPSSALTLKMSIEKAILEGSPDVSAIEVVDRSQHADGAHPAGSHAAGPPASGFVPVEQLLVGKKRLEKQGALS